MSYTTTIEKLSDCFTEVIPLWEDFYNEKAGVLAAIGIESPRFNPRLDVYEARNIAGEFYVVVLRHEGVACGYASGYITNSMHNGSRIAQEDSVFVSKEHRATGAADTLTAFVLDTMKGLGVVTFTASVIPRAVKLATRAGFKEVATQMCYTF